MAGRVLARCGTRYLLAGITLLAGGLAITRGKRARAEPPPAPAEGPPVPSAYERATLIAVQRQAWGTIVGAIAGAAALLVSLAAFFISIRTWQSQTEHDERVYSAQVALWATVGTDVSSVLPAGLDVHVQNLAPVPMHQALIIAPLVSGETAEVSIGDMPPCTIQSFRIAPPTGQRFVKGAEQWLGYTDLILEFAESSHSWRLTKDSLDTLPSPPRPGRLPTLVQANHQLTPAANCG